MNANWISKTLVASIFAWWAVAPLAQAYYNPSAGRWLNRDPIEEKGGIGVYGMVQNEPLSKTDYKGLAPVLQVAGGQPRPGNCGSFIWTATWSLGPYPEAADSIFGGIIVQHVSASFDITDCRGQQLGRPVTMPSNINPNSWPLFEAWTVPPGRPRTTEFLDRGSPIDDSFQFAPFDERNVGVPTRGTIVITGVADYYDGQSMPDHFVATGQPPTHGLPTSSYFWPLVPGSGAITRTLVATWDCCCNTEAEKRTKVSVTTTR